VEAIAMAYEAGAAIINVFRGNYPGNRNQWQLSWDVTGSPSLEIRILKKSNDWKKDWKDFVLLKGLGFADSSFGQNVPESATLVDQIATQEIFCNTVMRFTDTLNPDFCIVRPLMDHATNEDIRDALQYIVEQSWEKKLRMEFSIRLLDREFDEVFKSARDGAKTATRFGRSPLVERQSEPFLWQI